MYEINITKLVGPGFKPELYSASQAELGSSAGPITWINALERAASGKPVLHGVALPAFKAYLRDFGAWSDEEVDGFSDVQLNALLIQLVAGDIREGDTSRLFTGDDSRTYYTIGA